VITGPDHFVLLVNNLNDAIKTWRDLGFDARPGGEHPSTGTHNALVALADGAYVEILAFKDFALAEKSASAWRDGARRLRVHEGFGAYVLGSNDLARDIEPLRAHSINLSDPIPGSRVRPDGQTVAWRTAFVDHSATGLMPFIIQDETPRTLRIEPPSEGLGKLARVAQIVVGVNNPELAQEKYRGMLGVEPRRVHNTGGDVEGYRFAFKWGNIVLAHSTREGNALADEVNLRGEGLYAITLAFANLGDAWSELNQRGVRLEKDGNGYLIPPDAACGARIRLAQK